MRGIECGLAKIGEIGAGAFVGALIGFLLGWGNDEVAKSGAIVGGLFVATGAYRRLLARKRIE